MNILLVIFNANPSNGGAERYTADLAAGLLSRGHRVSIATAILNPNPPGDLEQIQLSSEGLTRNAKYRSFLNSLDRLLETRKFDRVHAMLPVRKCDFYHPHAGIEWDWMIGGVRWFKRISNPRRFLAASIESDLLKTNARVICLSDYIKRQLLAHYACPPERLCVVYNGVDLLRFSPGEPNPKIRKMLNIPEDAPVGLMIANDFERKGLMETLIAMKISQNIALKRKLPGNGMHLIVAGKENAKSYQSSSKVFEIADRVHFIGRAENVVELYRTCDFFVLPTKHDPCSLVVLEALASGLPIITTKQNGAGELAGKAGIVIDSHKQYIELTEALDHLCDREKRKTMQAECLSLREGLSQEKHLDQIIKIYSEDLTL